MLDRDLILQLEQQLRLMPELTLKLTEPQLDKTLVDCRLNYPQLEVPVHTGSYVEIMAVFRGQVVQVVEDTSIALDAGSILLTSPLTRHGVLPSAPDALAVNLAVSPYFFDMTGDIFRGTSELSLFLADIPRKNSNGGQYLLFSVEDHLPIQKLFDVLLRVYFLRPEEQDCGWTDADRDRIASSCLSSILFYLYKEVEPTLSRLPLEEPRTLGRTVQKYIESNYRTATLRELARLTSCSESTLSRTILRLTGQSFSSLLQRKRFKKAAELLETTMLPVSDIATAVGYECQSFFYRRFQSIYGCSPASYRRSHNKKKI